MDENKEVNQIVSEEMEEREDTDSDKDVLTLEKVFEGEKWLPDELESQ